MSGGSWDYVFGKFEDIAQCLLDDRCWDSDKKLELDERQKEARHRLGVKIQAIGKALHAIEWVDSYDCSTPHDVNAIEEALRVGT